MTTLSNRFNISHRVEFHLNPDYEGKGYPAILPVGSRLIGGFDTYFPVLVDFRIYDSKEDSLYSRFRGEVIPSYEKLVFIVLGLRSGAIPVTDLDGAPFYLSE